MSRMIIETFLDVNKLELVSNRSLVEVEKILSDAGNPKEILWRDAEGEWWIHIQRASGYEIYYKVMIRDSHDELLLMPRLFKSLKEIQQQTPFRLCDFRIADAWTNKREWLL